MLFLCITQLLFTFDVLRTVDGNGAKVEPLIEVAPRIHAELVEFSCRIVPRNAEKVAFLRKMEAKIPVHGSDAGLLDGFHQVLGQGS